MKREKDEPARILIVDDEALNRKLLGNALEREHTINPNDPKQMHWKGEIKAGWALIAGILCLPQSRKTRRRRTTSREAKQSRFEASLQQ